MNTILLIDKYGLNIVKVLIRQINFQRRYLLKMLEQKKDKKLTKENFKER